MKRITFKQFAQQLCGQPDNSGKKIIGFNESFYLLCAFSTDSLVIEAMFLLKKAGFTSKADGLNVFVNVTAATAYRAHQILSIID